MPRPLSATVMTTLPPACSAEIVSVPVGGLAGGLALLGAFEAVVERVAHEVHERVAERVDDGAVELGVLADEVQLDLLAELGREVAHEPREAQEDGLHRDHPDLHDHRLQRVRGAREVLHGLREARDVGARGERLDLRAVQDELAHEVHQLIEPLGVDADRRGAALGVRAWRRAGCGRGGGSGRLRGGRARPRPRASPAWARRRRRDVDLRLALVERGVGDGLEDHHVRDLGHGGGGVGQLGVGVLGDHPGVDLAAVERVDLVRRRPAGERLAQLGDRRQHHVAAHGRHRDVLVEDRRDLDHAAAVGQLGQVVRGRRGAGALGLLHRRALAHEALQALDQRLRLDRLLAGLVDRLDGRGERVEAVEQHVDRGALEPAAALAQQLEDVLHLMRERRHAGEAHRRAHPLHGVRDTENLVDRLRVVGLFLDPDHREVELLQVLTPLGQEHGEVLVHQPFR